MNTTISVSKSIREQIKELGNKGETYNEILERLLKSAKERQLEELLMENKNSLSIDEAIEKAKKRWQ